MRFGGDPRLSPQLQRFAVFALDKAARLALDTVATRATAGVQPSAMVRCAGPRFRRLLRLQQVFRQRLVGRPKRSYRGAPAFSAGSRRSGPAAVLTVRRGRSIAPLERSTIWPIGARAAVTVRAARIHVLAQRRAFPVACYLAYALAARALQRLLDGVGGMLSESAQLIGDELLADRHRSNYSPEVIEPRKAATRARCR